MQCDDSGDLRTGTTVYLMIFAIFLRCKIGVPGVKGINEGYQYVAPPVQRNVTSSPTMPTFPSLLSGWRRRTYSKVKITSGRIFPSSYCMHFLCIQSCSTYMLSAMMITTALESQQYHATKSLTLRSGHLILKFARIEVTCLLLNPEA